MRSNIIWLSYPLSPDTPAYGGGEGMHIEQLTRISVGDTANTSRFVFPNHLGTHVDAPRHFFDSGPSLTDYPPEFWIFENPLIVDVPGDDGYLVGPEDVESKMSTEIDLLLLRTGFEKYRFDSRYWRHNPGISAELGNWLRKQYPKVRIVGIDVISITSRHHRNEGRSAHYAFLNPKGPGKPVLVVEDMSLSDVNGHLIRAIILPLIVSQADGSPCTAIGYIS